MNIYKNGNYLVLYNKYTFSKTYRAVKYDDPIFKADFPDSIDLKLTNKCNVGCPFCHESSTNSGKEFDIDRTKLMLNQLPDVGIELAIGGGDLLTIDQGKLNEFLLWCSDKNFLTRCTINSKSVNAKNLIKFKAIVKTVSAVGISIDSLSELERLDKLLKRKSSDQKSSDQRLSAEIRDAAEILDIENKMVVHIIVGKFPLEELDSLFKKAKKVLILGYKSFGRASGTVLNEDLLEKWRNKLAQIVYSSRILGMKSKNNYHNEAINIYVKSLPFRSPVTLALDNLSVEQLNIRDTLTEDEFKSWYMGPDFSHSMYVDAVSEQFAPNSTSVVRANWKDYNYNIVNYFKSNRVLDEG